MLNKDNNTPRREGARFNDPVAAATTIFAGALVALNAAGNAVRGGTASSGAARGVAIARADNSGGAAGDISVESERGTFRLKNSAAGDLITRAHIGQPAYIVDDETVALTSNGATRSVAGRIADVDANGVWVEVGTASIAVTIEEGG